MIIDHWTLIIPTWNTWALHPSVAAGLVLLGGLYVYLGGLRSARRHVASFAGALAVLFVALNGPLHNLSDTYLFSAHMAQHLVLTLVFPPLLLYGSPAHVVRPLLRPRWVMALGRVVTRPLVAAIVFTGPIVIWHVPALYEAALRNHNLHIVQHLIFIATSVLLWWPVLSPVPELPRASYPGQVIYLFAIGLPMSAVGAFATLAEHPLYPFYAAAPRVWGLSALDDQRYGGLIMWVGGTLVLWIAATVVWFRWAWREEKGEAERAVPLEAYVLEPRAATPRPPIRPGDGV
ncbi:MAG TPA: cytochrome c oxidase assembly protein [Gemmatimonadales bacterium]|nr:cytochrome c oxidase assembly protein [Gemmatimonadales bacterium]